MPDTNVSGGLLAPPTPVEASPHAATIRAAHLTGSREICMLRVAAREVRDQLKLEACVSCASAAAMEMRHQSVPALSEISHYRMARVDRRFGNSVGRLTVSEGLATLERAGIAARILHDAPMTDEGLARPISSAAKADALKHRLPRQALFPGHEPIGAGSRVVGIRRHLKQGRPVLLGFRLPRTYPDKFLGPHHQCDNPSIDLSPDGHCVVVIGFDDVRQALRIQDSRGRRQAFDEGCWWMGYAVADSAAILVASSLMVRP